MQRRILFYLRSPSPTHPIIHLSLHSLPLFSFFPPTLTPSLPNPGANRADGHLCEWISILVKTGVYNDATAEHKAKYVVADVAEAFRLILELEEYQV